MNRRLALILECALRKPVPIKFDASPLLFRPKGPILFFASIMSGPAAIPHVRPSLAELSQSGKHRVLIVDDSPPLQRSMMRAIQRVRGPGQDSFEVDAASSGEEAVDLVDRACREQRRYSVAFVDRGMPGWDGIETIAHMWEHDPEIEIVICTASMEGLGPAIADRFGRADYILLLQKPFDVLEAQQLAHALSEKWRLRQETKRWIEELESRVEERSSSLQAAHETLHSEMKERERMELELMQAHKLEAVGQLAAGIAHEINTPIQYVSDNTHFLQRAFSGMMDLLDAYAELGKAVKEGSLAPEVIQRVEQAAKKVKGDYLRKQVPRAIEQTLEGLDRVAQIVRAMKEFSHPCADEKTLIDLNRAIETTVTVARNEWKYIADVELNLDRALEPVETIPGAINQVILNLVVNAAHAIADVVKDGSNGKGKIEITTCSRDGYVETRISDTGPGIPDAIKEKVFNPFFTTKAVGKGTGQGLAIARSVVVDKHGGRIFFEPRGGGGTTFVIQLPATRGAGGRQESSQ